MKNLILPFILLLTFVLSCSDNTTDEVLEKKNTSYDVYIAGRENSKACYWKNNVKTDLTNGDNINPLEIIVQNNNVYVTGTNGSTPTALKPIHYFWKNGTRYEIKQYLNLPNTGLSEITSFTVNNDDIYFSGYVENPAATSNFDKYELCYWKNSVKTILYKSQYTPSAEGIAATNSTIGTDVYVSARITDNNQNTDRGYFKNTTFNSLNQPTYVFNFTKNNDGLHLLFQKNASFYSKNLSTNVETLIGFYSHPVPIFGKIASDIHTSDLYTIYYNQGNSYYKNTATVTPNFSTLAYIQDLFVLNNNIYIIKYSNTNNTTYNGKVFINGVETQTITSTQNSSQNFTGTFNAIYVVEN
ncbi:hypothetical protein [Chryseobacterium taiwanense]|uniref:Lipoprotein n=1 Tax=Chryseobacterium taiwanense TaxID=363331 RepID=A0A0B4DA87_9FLAO|nr:hypothetical protein [Chryseobacterium taiwanense]KIC63616.1 hypothetical protein RM51_08130 [Chryseobacterium taiwanense]